MADRHHRAIQAAEGKLYLGAIKDVWSNLIVGYSMDSRMKSQFAVNALRMAIGRRDQVAATVHSDRGSQFRSRRFLEELRHHGLTGSMGRVGAAGDNAAMERASSACSKTTSSTNVGGPPATN